MSITKKYFIKYLLLPLILLLSVSGCARVKWAPATEKPADLVWPEPPAVARARYLGEINHFQQTSSNLASVIFGKSRAGKIIKPAAVAIGSDGRLAIADLGKKGVHLYLPGTSQYLFLIRTGKTILQTPVGLAFDASDNLYVADSTLKKIVKFDGEGRYVNAVSNAGDQPLLRPTGICFNGTDNRLYVTDALLHRVLVYNLRGELIEKLGSRGESSTDSLNFPTHIAADGNGGILITDSMNFRARIYDPQSREWRQFGHHGNGSGDFAMPKGIAADRNGHIYIAETLFDAVQIFDNTGTYLLTIGAQGCEPGQFWMPSGLFIDSEDKLYVCDTYNQRIQIFQLLTGQDAERPE